MEQIRPLPATTAPDLRLSLREGKVDNEFLRQGPVAAHLLLTSGSAARLLAAFPAGNSAAGVWFLPGTAPVQWKCTRELHAVESTDRRGRPLYGIAIEIGADSASLTVTGVVLSSARVLRDYQHDGRLPKGIHNRVQFSANTVRWTRDRLDGAPGYVLELQVPGGSVETDAAGRVTLTAEPGKTLRLKLAALSGETPLAPIPFDELLRDPDAGSQRARQSLAFLSYHDKLLAGSWRFNTYFGRDTLMSLLLLMPALTPLAIEAGLGSVLDRLDPQGAVAHEEDIGECALLHGGAGAPVYDYKMVDDDFMLAPVALAYLLEQPGGFQRAPHWLAEAGVNGEPRGATLCRNFRLVKQLAAGFARRPGIDQLIRLKPGQITGDWRDSADGLGGGVIPYNVNAILVPAALRAIANLAASGLLAPYGTHQGVAALAQVWETHAPGYFSEQRDAPAARLAVETFAAELGVAAGPAVASLSNGPLTFHAVALDTGGRPVPVLHSDFGFALMLQRPPADLIERELSAMMRPFPAGLMTGVGLLVANGAYADETRRPLFGPDRYHGAVVWSWQQGLLAAGLARQLARTDLTANTRALLTRAQAALWAVILPTQAQGNSELWSWTWENGSYRVAPFGPGAATADESNAVQLWSTVYLAVRPPSQADTIPA